MQNDIISHLFSFLVNSTTENKKNYALKKKPKKKNWKKWRLNSTFSYQKDLMVQINYTLIILYPVFRCPHKFCILVNCNLKSLPNCPFFFLPTTVSLWWCPTAHLFSISFCLFLTWEVSIWRGDGGGACTKTYKSKGVEKRCKLIKMKTKFMSKRNPLLTSLLLSVLFLRPLPTISILN